ncbi:MAG: TIGR01212 family radical SAM protein [Candidatus Melainabacteria bacterium]|nr:TIGR01212 family radical SAM protein [Candidatus Melainabacteria bacterium]
MTFPSSLPQEQTAFQQAPLPFNSYNHMLQRRFGCRVYKISLDGGFTCPNIDGQKGHGGCTFCDETGSSSRTRDRRATLHEQMLKNIAKRQQRFGAQKFIAYFQSHTNTYDTPDRLKKRYDEAIQAHPDVVGLAVSTRPDCVDEEKLSLLASYRSQLPLVCVEYGLQTIHNHTLAAINRCETYEDFEHALKLTQAVGLEHCVHVILGLPGESWQEQMSTAERLAQLRVDGVKIHLLVAMEKTPIAQAYEQGQWQPLAFQEYVALVCDFLERLHPECVIHRVAGNGHPKHVVAPRWLQQQRDDVIQAIIREFANRGTRQGSRFAGATLS